MAPMAAETRARMAAFDAASKCLASTGVTTPAKAMFSQTGTRKPVVRAGETWHRFDETAELSSDQSLDSHVVRS